jgi:hypothetical protein
MSEGGHIEHDLISGGFSLSSLLALNAFTLRDCNGVQQSIGQVLRQPNSGGLSTKTMLASEDTSGLARALVKSINGAQRTCATRCCCWGHLVPDGYIQFIEHSGRTEAVSDGRWVLGLHRASWAKICHVREARISYGNVSIAWVQRGQYGLAWDSGREVLLDEGLHVYNDPGFFFERCVNQRAEYICHGTLHIVRVPHGSLAKVMVSTSLGGVQPRLLPEGLYVVDSSLFSYNGLVSANETHTMHGMLHLLRVPHGHAAKIVSDGQAELLGPGYHFFESSMVHHVGLASLSAKVIRHEAITLVRVSKGELAVAWLNNEPLLLEDPGIYGYDTADFNYVRHQPVSDKVIAIGSKKIITVNAGETCITHQHGALRLLQRGRHVLEDASHTVDGFVPTEACARAANVDSACLTQLIRAGQDLPTFTCCRIERPASGNRLIRA